MRNRTIPSAAQAALARSLRTWQLLLTALFALHCAKNEHRAPAGSLVVAVQSDMSVPKDINEIRIQARVDGELREDRVFLIAPAGPEQLPITLTLPANTSEDKLVDVSVVGLLDDEPRVFARAVTQMPQDRSALLRLPLQWLCDGSAQAGPKQKVESSCAGTDGETQTCVAGSCVSAELELEELPDYEPEEVYGGGDAPEANDAQCFDTAPCFDQHVALSPNAECVVQLPFSSERLPALGLMLPQPGAGICGDAGCYIPLDHSEQLGWSVLDDAAGNGTLAQLPASVCTKLSDGSVQDVVASLVCPAKTPRMPTCGLWSAVDRSINIAVLPLQPEADASAPEAEPDAAVTPSTTQPDAGTHVDVPSTATPASSAEAGAPAPSASEPGVNVVITPHTLVSLKLSPAQNEVPVGVSAQLSATGVYADGTSEELTAQVEWSSADASVASVSESGSVLALAPGSTQVHATLEGITASALFTVTDAEAVTLSVTPAEMSLPAGFTGELVASASFTDGSTRTVTADCEWQSDTSAVAGISSAGLVTALTPGTAQITAQFAGLSAQTGISVSEAVLQRLSIEPSSANVPAGLSTTLTATAAFSDGSARDVSLDVTWQSSSPEVAAVDASGNVIALLLGSSEISAQLDELSASATVTVTDEQLLALRVIPDLGRVPVGGELPFAAEASFSNGTTRDVTLDVVWSSDNINVATIDALGVASGVNEGSTAVLATLGDFSAQASLVVSDAVVESLSITPDAASIAQGRSVSLVARATYSDGAVQDVSQRAQWSSDDVQLASVDNAGSVHGVNPGQVTVSAQFEGFLAEAVINVTDAELVELQVTPDSVRLPAGETQQLSAWATYSDGSSDDVSEQVEWSSDNAAAAVVDASGLARAVEPGSALVRAELEGLSAQSVFEVTSAALVALTISPQRDSVAKGRSVQFTATATYSDDTALDVTAQALWTSDDINIASVTGGLATGLQVATTTLRASLGDWTASATLAVTEAVLVSLDVLPGQATLNVGQTVSLAAWGTFSDQSTREVTAAWESNNTRVATLPSAGVVRGVAGGTATIRASVDGISDTANITVLAVQSVTITPDSALLRIGDTTQFSASATYSDGSTRTVTSEGTWSVASVSIAELTAAGTVHALDAGITSVSFTLDNRTDSAEVTVRGLAVSSLRINPSSATINLGQEVSLRAIATLVDGREVNVTSNVTWGSNHPAISVQGGLVLGGGVGQATITATYSRALSAQASVTVTGPRLVSVPAAISLAVGQKVMLAISVVSPTGEQRDVTRSCRYESTETKVVQVDVGNVSAVGQGNAVVKVTFDNLSLDVPATIRPRGQ